MGRCTSTSPTQKDATAGVGYWSGHPPSGRALRLHPPNEPVRPVQVVWIPVPRNWWCDPVAKLYHEHPANLVFDHQLHQFQHYLKNPHMKLQRAFVHNHLLWVCMMKMSWGTWRCRRCGCVFELEVFFNNNQVGFRRVGCRWHPNYRGEAPYLVLHPYRTAERRELASFHGVTADSEGFRTF